ncbi:hypothetical protein [Conchiformibius kuhniae]|uniref:Uncharacterized protein n=1 Tax=Conchiformibius kuhniae TaxID=211502 RepID=A0ABD8B6N4_9NEIS|nr:hypothetical protein [Conchiformibius kuhniae]
MMLLRCGLEIARIVAQSLPVFTKTFAFAAQRVQNTAFFTTGLETR